MQALNLSTNQLRYLVRLSNNRSFRKKEQKAFVEGENVVNQILEYKKEIIEYLVVSDNYLTKPSCKVYLASNIAIQRLSSYSTGFTVAALINTKVLDSTSVPPDLKGLYVGLVDIQDPGNIGTIFRTCLAFNIKGIFLMGSCAYPLTTKVIQASTGAVFRIPFYKISSAEELKEKFQNRIYGTSLSAEKTYKNIDIKDGIVLFGNEGQGLSKSILNSTEYNINIPIENIDSLNVGVSVGIICSWLFESGNKV
ncbi:hypothetical protein COV24_04520 [candidate division WWE3 bacterium CG10_big_fil_rev_8_21_14_0_10_32_10]|uniref:tRNA/rRNA methyltransferase SpoU type domain-containing protein n=1 Tax=candidate division WWE3 bacterium CG10_big_fil_rev_8_21_14_0_10_32_10 TaxID=1975090 RepID=A0A2H0R978_UNCKA|nr:MAG: hypothetical protein COV24_04520 [candidate division WWE3 bacterium CG10_big_fil_rev_8_21_14_0_10_32_10]